MFDLINDLIVYFGFSSVPTSFDEFIVWLVAALFGIEFVLFITDSVFYTIRQICKGVK